jgi:anti-sigma factor RsiW
MNCRQIEREIALYVEGDLPGRKQRQVGEHLAACGRCRDLVAGLEASQAMVKSLRGDEADDASLDEIRARVMANLRAEPQPRRSWRWAYAAAAALALVAVTWLFRPQYTPPELPRPVIAVPPVPSLAALPHRPAQAVRRRRPRPVPALHGQRSAEPLVVKLETSDPDVVIYWIIDSKGD